MPRRSDGGREGVQAAGLKVMSGGNIDLKETTVEGMRKHFEYAKARRDAR